LLCRAFLFIRNSATTWFLLCDDDGDYHDVLRADTERALTWWWRLGALHEATNKIHWSMCLTPYQPGGMVITFIIDFITFFYIIDNRVANKLINTLTVNGFSSIALTTPSASPSTTPRLRWIRSNYKFRANGGGRKSPW
jgi:hypothetical protein